MDNGGMDNGGVKGKAGNRHVLIICIIDTYIIYINRTYILQHVQR